MQCAKTRGTKLRSLRANSILRNSGEMGGMRGTGRMGGIGGIGGMKFDFFYTAGTKHRSHRSD